MEQYKVKALKYKCLDASGNWQPVQFYERYDMRSLWLIKDHYCCCILDQLQRLDS